MGTARWADGRSLEKRREKLNCATTRTPHEKLPSIPLFFLKIKYFSLVYSRSPEMDGQLPRAGLPAPPHPQTVALQPSLQAQAAPRGSGSQNPREEESNGCNQAGDCGDDADSSPNHRPNTANSSAFVILTETATKLCEAGRILTL